MKRYTEYKDSGVEWIGEIPKDWTSVKLKFLVSEKLKYGANEPAESDDPDNPRYIRITDFGVNGLLRSDTFKSLPNEVAEPYLLSEGDILFARSGATVGKTFQFKDFDGRACYAGYLIKASFEQAKYNSDFIYYFTKSYSYENWKNSIVQQATIENIGADKYNNLFISIPPSVEEQTQIARYLDHKTAQIDKLISDKEKLIELLNEERTAMINQAVTKGLNPDVPMKDSGIEWLGEVPEHWEVKRLKFIGIAFGGLTYAPENIVEETDGTLVLRSSNIQNGKLSLEDNVYVNSKISDKLTLKKGDILICSRNGSQHLIGKNICIGEDMAGNTFGAFMMIFRSKNWKFLKHYFNSAIFTSQSGLFLTATINQLTTNTLNNFWIAIPESTIEQEEISKYIDEKKEEIETIVKKTNQEIQLLKEYKTALISEVVTGKVDVRDEIIKPEAFA